MFSPLLDELIESLRFLPGVGPKSAQRMALHLLERGRDNAKKLSQVLAEAVDKVGHCENCRTFSEEPVCRLCANKKRDASLLCVVETPADVLAVEQAGSFRGYYFVLMGHLSPLDGIGPDAIGLPMLKERMEKNTISEIIVATNPTVEGEATAHYIAQMAKALNIKISRIAHGVPLGGELEFVDGGTLAHAFDGRTELS